MEAKAERDKALEPTDQKLAKMRELDAEFEAPLDLVEQSFQPATARHAENGFCQ